MNLSSVKAKETKGKQKVLPKLKTILASPNKTKCPVLNEQEMEELKLIFQKAMVESDLQARKYATIKGISLGLESSLRNINNKKSGCVFISLSIKPTHVVSLIARNAKIRDETQPVYAQPKLENFIEQLFGIKSLCMVLPNDLLNISKELCDWVEKKKKPKKVTNTITTKENKKRILKKKLKKPKEQYQDLEIEENKKSEKENLVKPFSEDYISFGGTLNSKSDQSKLNDDEVVDAMTKIMDKIPTASLRTNEVDNIEPMEVEPSKNILIIEHKECTDQEDSDSFLNSSEYKPLTVHKIKGNPNKNPKKKRTKNKKKILKK